MGMLYKRQDKPPDGSVAEGAAWWITYDRNRVAMRTSAACEEKGVAQ